jgi:hypothetical protein
MAQNSIGRDAIEHPLCGENRTHIHGLATAAFDPKPTLFAANANPKAAAPIANIRIVCMTFLLLWRAGERASH